MKGLVPAIAALVVLLCAPARAQEETDTLATATSLFDAAQALVQQGRVEEACPMFEESYRLAPANGTLINLADCNERIGKTATAWLMFRDVAHRSEAEGQNDRAAVARKRLEQLRLRLMHIKVVLEEGARVPGLVVERDAVELSTLMLGVAVPVDPGEHQVRARAPGHRSWWRTVSMQKPGETIEITVPRLEPLRAEAPPPVRRKKPPEPDPRAWQMPLGIAAFAVGAATLIAGVAVGAAAKVKADAADCDADDFCSPQGLADRDDAVVLGNIGTGVGVAGAVIAAVGLTVWLTAPAPKSALGMGMSLGAAF
jgi:hypothetical protein